MSAARGGTTRANQIDSIIEETMFDYARVKRFMRWTRKRFKDKTVEQVWDKIQETPKLLKDYETFDSIPPTYSGATANIEFAIKTYGWRELMEAIWIVATKKEETMSNLGFKEEEAKWTKVKDKLSQIPKNVQR
jgi:hypothetical protein